MGMSEYLHYLLPVVIVAVFFCGCLDSATYADAAENITYAEAVGLSLRNSEVLDDIGGVNYTVSDYAVAESPEGDVYMIVIQKYADDGFPAGQVIPMVSMDGEVVYIGSSFPPPRPPGMMNGDNNDTHHVSRDEALELALSDIRDQGISPYMMDGQPYYTFDVTSQNDGNIIYNFRIQTEDYNISKVSISSVNGRVVYRKSGIHEPLHIIPPEYFSGKSTRADVLLNSSGENE
ncbi:hypothetical protein [Methanoplanus endosymbiosus]|uniref:PepSY domain-containing protein n=1 Tax=Methanoplanus endosymbiosus TaxID=33865 RepID=A0A9E7TL36_9EURY|nr:hypothetical protein [Methanoplanus endosymbiosus]UUX93300.1 hypothetical protein L6E24_04020 [Methanoplanus endosymbiosus]